MSTTLLSISLGYFVSSGKDLYLLRSPAFGVLEGTYKEMRDHSKLILQVLRKHMLFPWPFLLRSVWLLLFSSIFKTVFQQWKEYFYAGLEVVINTLLSLGPSQTGN